MVSQPGEDPVAGGAGDPIDSSEFVRGNPVVAIEWIPPKRADMDSDMLDPELSEPIQVDYGEGGSTTKWSEIVTDGSPSITLDLKWQYVYGSRIMESNPIIGYHLYRADELAPYPGQIERFEPKTIKARREAYVNVVPWLEYRSTPSSVFPVGMKSGSQGSSDTIRTDWRPIVNNSSIQIWQQDECQKLPDGNHSPHLEYVQDLFASGPVWLFKPIILAAERLREAMEKTYRIKTKRKESVELEFCAGSPLEDRSSAMANISSMEQKIKSLWEQPYDEVSDPMAWRTLESLGLSCECRFRTRSGEYLGPEFLGDPDSSAKVNWPVGIRAFLASDYQTHLFVVRLVLETNQWELFRQDPSDTEKFYLAEPLGLLLKGRGFEDPESTSGRGSLKPKFLERIDLKDVALTSRRNLSKRGFRV